MATRVRCYPLTRCLGTVYLAKLDQHTHPFNQAALPVLLHT